MLTVSSETAVVHKMLTVFVEMCQVGLHSSVGVTSGHRLDTRRNLSAHQSSIQSKHGEGPLKMAPSPFAEPAPQRVQHTGNQIQ